MTERDRDEIIDEVLAAINGMSGDEWVDDPAVQRQSPVRGQIKAIRARVAAMKSQHHIIGA